MKVDMTNVMTVFGELLESEVFVWSAEVFLKIEEWKGCNAVRLEDGKALFVEDDTEVQHYPDAKVVL